MWEDKKLFKWAANSKYVLGTWCLISGQQRNMSHFNGQFEKILILLHSFFLHFHSFFTFQNYSCSQPSTMQKLEVAPAESGPRIIAMSWFPKSWMTPQRKSVGLHTIWERMAVRTGSICFGGWMNKYNWREFNSNIWIVFVLNFWLCWI